MNFKWTKQAPRSGFAEERNRWFCTVEITIGIIRGLIVKNSEGTYDYNSIVVKSLDPEGYVGGGNLIKVNPWATVDCYNKAKGNAQKAMTGLYVKYASKIGQLVAK